MTRETSIQAYNQIKDEGLLSALRFQVYESLIENGSMTAQESWHYLRDKAARRGEARINGITPRFSELRELGVVYEKTVRPCKITKRNAIEWEVTDQLPVKKEAIKKEKCPCCGRTK